VLVAAGALRVGQVVRVKPGTAAHAEGFRLGVIERLGVTLAESARERALNVSPEGELRERMLAFAEEMQGRGGRVPLVRLGPTPLVPAGLSVPIHPDDLEIVADSAEVN
jgi:hypothetical protein